MLCDLPVFVAERGFGDGPAVRVDIERNACPVEAVDGVVRNVRIHIGLQVAGRAAFQENILFFQALYEAGIFDAADTVTDAGRVEVVEGFDNAARTFGLAGMCSAGNIVLMCILEGGDMVVDRESGLAGCDVESDDMGVFEFFDEVDGFHALVF